MFTQMQEVFSVVLKTRSLLLTMFQGTHVRVAVMMLLKSFSVFTLNIDAFVCFLNCVVTCIQENGLSHSF